MSTLGLLKTKLKTNLSLLNLNARILSHKRSIHRNLLNAGILTNQRALIQSHDSSDKVNIFSLALIEAGKVFMGSGRGRT